MKSLSLSLSVSFSVSSLRVRVGGAWTCKPWLGRSVLGEEGSWRLLAVPSKQLPREQGPKTLTRTVYLCSESQGWYVFPTGCAGSGERDLEPLISDSKPGAPKAVRRLMAGPEAKRPRDISDRGIEPLETAELVRSAPDCKRKNFEGKDAGCV